MNIRLVAILIAAGALLSISACSNIGAIEIGREAPDFSLTAINGDQVSLSSFKGKVVMLNFFASWCPPCKHEVPDFIELQKEYGDKDFSIIGIALVSAGDARNFATQFGINYPVLVDDGRVSDTYGPIRSIPTTFIIDKEGRITKMYIGFRSKKVFESDIKEMIR